MWIIKFFGEFKSTVSFPLLLAVVLVILLTELVGPKTRTLIIFVVYSPESSLCRSGRVGFLEILSRGPFKLYSSRKSLIREGFK